MNFRHGPLRPHPHSQRKVALFMIVTGLVRVVVWLTMLLLGLVPSVRHLYQQVSFVTFLSLLALLLTDWSQVAGSMAQLAASDAHHEAKGSQ